MTDGASWVNGEAWDEGCCYTAGEARAGRWSRRLIIEVARRAPGAELFRSAGGHYDVYEGGAGFVDVLRTEVDFLHRHAKTAAQRAS